MRVAKLCTSVAFILAAASVPACGSGDSTVSFGDDSGTGSTYDAPIDNTVSSSSSGSSSGGSSSGGGSGSSSGGGMCTVHCHSDHDCQTGCSQPPNGVLCCDVSSAICFTSHQTFCPVAIPDASVDVD